MRCSMLLTGMVFVLVSMTAGCQSHGGAAAEVESALVLHGAVVEASYGQCQLGLPGTGCDLAVRIDGVAYYVDGTGIDDHGDAHAHDGFCSAVRRARVDGHIEGGRIVVESFELLPDK